MARRSINHKRRAHRRGRNQKSQFPIKLFLGGSTIAAVLGTTAYLTIQEAGYTKADSAGCYAQVSERAQTVALVDVSEPRFDEAQTRDLVTGFSQLYARGLVFNEQFSIVTTQENRIGSVPSPIMSFCRSARTQGQLKQVGAAGATPEYLNRKTKSFFKKKYQPALAEIFNANPADAQRQSRESQILEQIQGVARMANFSEQNGKRRLILVSDLIQTTREAQFCTKKGHMPTFEKFKKTPYFARVKPKSLSGVEVTVYMLIRGGYGGKQLPYCREDELRSFWSDYFKEAGVSSVDIIRLRTGGKSGSGQ